jgi:hypothetical protein
MKSRIFFHIIIIIVIIVLTGAQIGSVYGDNVIMQVNQPVNPGVRSSLVDYQDQSSIGIPSSFGMAERSLENFGEVNQHKIPTLKTSLVDNPVQSATGIQIPSLPGNREIPSIGTTLPVPAMSESLSNALLPVGATGMKKIRAYDSYLNYLKQDSKVSMASSAQIDDIISFPYRTDKKIIEFGTDAPTARWVKNNVASMEQQPFDGVAFFPGNDKLNIWQPDAWRNNPDQFDLASLSEIKWNKFQGNNFLLLFSDRNEWYYLDYWDDTNWTQIEANMGALAKAARDNGCAGILFDTEYYYTKSPWSYADNNKGHTLVETQAQIRARGAQVMRAWQTQYPGITILFTSATESSANYNLLPYWVNGMLDVIGTDARLVDGNEFTYYLSDTIDWFNQYDKLKISKDRVAYLSPENEAKWAKNVEVGTAMYWELSTLLEGYYPNTAQIIKDRWEHNAYIGLVTSDKWVWTFSHDINWWGVPVEDQPLRCYMGITGVPTVASEGIRNAKDKYFAHQKLGWDLEGYLPETSATVQITNTNPVIVNATTTNGVIYRVDFYLNNVLVDSSNNQPYTADLTSVLPGRYSLIAQAQVWSDYENKNYSGTSQPVEIILPFTQSAPTITSISPNSGTNDGNISAIISGTNFRNGATVKLTSGSIIIPATVHQNTGNQITCNLHLTGFPSGLYDLHVVNNDETSATISGAFTINSVSVAPNIISITPNYGLTITNTKTSITGTNFRPGVIVQIIKGTTVKKATISSNSGSKIVCTIPTKNSNIGLWDVKITNIDGTTVTLKNGFTIKYYGRVSNEVEPGLVNNVVMNSPVTITSFGVPSLERNYPSGGGLVPVIVPIISPNP